MLEHSFIPLTYEQIFGEKPDSIQSYIRPLGKERVLLICARCAEQSIKDQQDNLFGFLFVFMPYVFEKYTNNLLLPMYEQFLKEHKYILIHQAVLYDIMEQALTMDDDCELVDEDDPISQELFFRALLAANSAFLAKQERIRAAFDDGLSQERLFKTMLANLLAYDSFSNRDLNFVLLTQFLKSTMFLQYMNETYPDHVKALMSEYGCDDWRVYQRALSALIFRYIDSDENKDIPTQIEAEENSLFQRILLRNSITSEDKFEKFTDHKCLRMHPVYTVSPTHFLVLSKNFLIERLHSGLIFDFMRINNSFKDSATSSCYISSFNSIRCSEFSENRLFYQLLNQIYKKKNCIHWTGQEMKAMGVIGEPDYYVRSGNNAFIFESKDVMCPASVRESNDPNIIDDFLYEKFVRQKDGQSKAIVQLINNMQLIAEGKLDHEAERLSVYPILVVHDYIFDTIGVNYQLIHWFNQELLSRKDEIFKWEAKIRRIAPVIILPIDTLIMLEKPLMRKGVKLDELIEDYVRQYLAVDDCRSWISFSNYLWDVFGEKHGLAPIIEEYMELLA